MPLSFAGTESQPQPQPESGPVSGRTSIPGSFTVTVTFAVSLSRPEPLAESGSVAESRGTPPGR